MHASPLPCVAPLARASSYRMHGRALVVLAVAAMACRPPGTSGLVTGVAASRDSAALAAMVATRERAMVERDLGVLAAQFADDVTWMTGGGSFYAGKPSVVAFHRGMLQNDSVTYSYRAGRVLVRLLAADDALVYYPWQMVWTSRAVPTDTALAEVGIMTITARRQSGAWRWVAVTNQRTTVFHDSIVPRR